MTHPHTQPRPPSSVPRIPGKLTLPHGRWPRMWTAEKMLPEPPEGQALLSIQSERIRLQIQRRQLDAATETWMRDQRGVVVLMRRPS